VLALMPSARDGARTIAFLAGAGIQCVSLSSLASVCEEFRLRGAGALLLTEDAVVRDAACLGPTLREQPKWSSVPIMLLARESSAMDVDKLIPNATFNVTIVEIPLRMRTLLSVVQSALRARRQQYEIRDAMVERERQAMELASQAKDLREADRRKDEFLATLAHELRNPLAPIRTGLDILKRTASEAAAARTREMMDRQLRHMVRLIDDLLDVSRITRGKMDLQKEPVTLPGVIEAAVEASRPLVEAGHHRLTVSLPDDQRPFRADPTRMAQIISNLLSNAAKYSHAGGQIVVDGRRDGPDVVIQVRDQGVGILRENLSEIFAMFSQVNRTLDRAKGGLGIGLALVRRLTEMHGGTVTAESEGANRGSTFTVRIPAEASPTAGLAEGGGLAGRPDARRILIVDDNIDAAETLSEFLELSGHQTRLAHTGPEAIDAAVMFHPAVVLLDIGLPGMDGYEVAHRLREDPSLSKTTLVAVTGWGTDEDKRKATRAGFDFHLTKPVLTESIEKLIANVTAK
jgi:signal transduction histidine kinase/CheY-like chemotaxis protein